MPKRCPPGIVCIENMTLVGVGILAVVIGYTLFRYISTYRTVSLEGSIKTMWLPPSPGQLRPDPDVLLNPYDAPLRDDRYFLMPQATRVPPYAMAMPLPVVVPPAGMGPANATSLASAVSAMAPSVPINIPTQYPGGLDSSYRQVGILTPEIGDKDLILPLMGKPLITNRDKWNFYTMNDKNTMIKLPITFKGKSGTSEYGVDNIYNNDTVYVQGYGQRFKATIYDNDTMRYLPFM